ncbi:AGAP002918-PA-like protein [Anopheles sinensis]|uniref:AGAP002918-PA-like protein n=1 Tax=Anopheles sinensis TaxID=74873 RepID=A0A084VH62_ANOSI|nr:AGAP002918-PA-like protein [Anopheles sinensis]
MPFFAGNLVNTLTEATAGGAWGLLSARTVIRNQFPRARELNEFECMVGGKECPPSLAGGCLCIVLKNAAIYFNMANDDYFFEITVPNLANCCRICLSNQTKWNIKDNYLHCAYSITIAEAIEAVANITVETKEHMSTNLCELCFTRLNDAYSLICDIRKNHENIWARSFSIPSTCAERTITEEVADQPVADESSDQPAVTDEASDELIIADASDQPITDEVSDDDGSELPAEPLNAVDLIVQEIAPAKRKALKHRPFKRPRVEHRCDECNKTFTRKSNLIDHERLHNQSKPYRCEYCDKRFVQIGNLRMHLRTHTAEKPFHCQLCERSFAQSGSLKMHIKSHANIKSYSCDTCDKAFLSSSDLVKHKFSHSDKKRFRCVICQSRYFTQKVHLRCHLERIHKLRDHQLLLSQGTLDVAEQME